ncbi:hypothetical protein MJ575_12760 [Klebsiella pneumoniae]|nr:hypothetical protein MJ575_12760 [Klebsiella pneumoniae]
MTIDYRIDNRRGKRVGANHHTEPRRSAGGEMDIESADAAISRGFSPQTSANELRVEVFYRFANAT